MRYTTRYRCYWLIWLIPLMLTPAQRPNRTGEFWTTVLDVGQGLAVVVSTKNHLLIYDTGPGNSDYNSGKKVVVPFTLDQHLRPLDLLVVSHGDNDHSGGANSVIEQASPNSVLTSAPQLFKHHLNVKQCHAGQHWQWDGVDFTILHPTLSLQKNNTSSNNCSCVLKISNHYHSVLLTGDIEQASEQQLLLHAQPLLTSTILIAPHHGSATSSTPAFIKQVAPQQVVFTTGYRNRFHLPNKRVIERYKQQQQSVIKLWNTAYSGAITFKIGKQKLKIDVYRQHHQRIWRSLKDNWNQIEW